MKNIYALLLFILPFALSAQEVYHIKFTDDNSVYNVAAVINADNTGLVRVNYIDSDCDGETIEMTATITETFNGFIINCHNPVYAGTDKKAKRYNPDTFYITMRDNDGWICKNIDSNKVETQCSFMEVTGISNQDIFLRDFGLEFAK